MNAWDKIVKGVAAACGAVAGLFVGYEKMMIVLLCCMAIDYATGLVVAALGKSQKTETGHLDSKIGFAGICKKALMLLVVLMAALLDKAMGTEGAVFRAMIVWFYVANESLSILENLSLAGVPFPAKIKDALEQLKAKNDTDDEGVG